MSGVCIALLSGALMSIQGVFNTEVTKQTSLWVSSAFVPVYGTSGLSYRLAFYRPDEFSLTGKYETALYAACRCDRRVYHGDGGKKHGGSRPGARRDADRDFAAGRRLCDRAVWNVRRGETAV